MAEARKFRNQEEVLQAINNRFIALPEKDEKRNNIILHKVIEKIVDCMCSRDPLFKDLLTRNRRIFYGGSYYDGLKVGKPDEYDIDLLLNFPKDVTISTSNIPGFVHVEITDEWEWWENFKMDKFCDTTKSTKYLENSKVLSWIESIIQKVLNSFERCSFNRNWYDLRSICDYDLYLEKVSKAGPAFTFKINGNIDGEYVYMSIDLVACFSFDNSKLPKEGFKINWDKMESHDFFVVPKKPTSQQYESTSSRYWRLSLQEQERTIMHGLEKAKPALKLLKKLRLTQNHCIDSYYLKTILLWEIQTQPNDHWITKSLSYIFMELLKQYKKYISKKKIPYFWNKNNNLIGSLNADALSDISNRLERIIKNIEKSDDPSIVAKYILTEQELDDFQRQADFQSQYDDFQSEDAQSEDDDFQPEYDFQRQYNFERQLDRVNVEQVTTTNNSSVLPLLGGIALLSIGIGLVTHSLMNRRNRR